MIWRASLPMKVPKNVSGCRKWEWPGGALPSPRGKGLTIALVDQAFRSRRPKRIADQPAYLFDVTFAHHLTTYLAGLQKLLA
jgi:hypothetical protein